MWATHTHRRAGSEFGIESDAFPTFPAFLSLPVCAVQCAVCVNVSVGVSTHTHTHTKCPSIVETCNTCRMRTFLPSYDRRRNNPHPRFSFHPKGRVVSKLLNTFSGTNHIQMQIQAPIQGSLESGLWLERINCVFSFRFFFFVRRLLACLVGCLVGV